MADYIVMKIKSFRTPILRCNGAKKKESNCNRCVRVKSKLMTALFVRQRRIRIYVCAFLSLRARILICIVSENGEIFNIDFLTQPKDGIKKKKKTTESVMYGDADVYIKWNEVVVHLEQKFGSLTNTVTETFSIIYVKYRFFLFHFHLLRGKIAAVRIFHVEQYFRNLKKKKMSHTFSVR